MMDVSTRLLFALCVDIFIYFASLACVLYTVIVSCPGRGQTGHASYSRRID